MVNCDWANALTRYDCKPLIGINGSNVLEVGTPFSLPDGSAINLYISSVSNGHLMISDNGDTLMHLSGMGIDVWNASRLRGLRDAMSGQRMKLDHRGDFRLITQQKSAAVAFAQSVTGILAVNNWAREQLRIEPADRDLVAEAEPYILARNPTEKLIRHVRVKGASRAEHEFDFRHGSDLIDVIAPSPQSTGGVMRKVGDVINGPFADPYSPLIIVDDRFEPMKAEKEMGILASIARTQPFSRLTQMSH
ncbi:MAG: hypothetical protein JWR80_2070 [Bradyrhizobium sp.]|nr:hypothetical protein [Bradyrhizobium sp.]